VGTKEKLYATYAKKCREIYKPLKSQDDFFALVGSVKDLFSSNPLETGEMNNDEWEVILS